MTGVFVTTCAVMNIEEYQSDVSEFSLVLVGGYSFM